MENNMQNFIKIVDELVEERADLLALLGKVVIRFDMEVYLANKTDYPECMELIDDIKHELTVRYKIDFRGK